MGSAGADETIRTNAFFESGQSQLLVISNAGHLPHIHNPQELAAAMIGFYNETMTGKFQEKAREDFVAPTPVTYPKL